MPLWLPLPAAGATVVSVADGDPPPDPPHAVRPMLPATVTAASRSADAEDVEFGMDLRHVAVQTKRHLSLRSGNWFRKELYSLQLTAGNVDIRLMVDAAVRNQNIRKARASRLDYYCEEILMVGKTDNKKMMAGGDAWWKTPRSRRSTGTTSTRPLA